MSGNHISTHRKITPDSYQPVILYGDEDHEIFWLGISEHKPFRSNTYLIRSGDEAILFDPGHRAYFERVRKRVELIIDPQQLAGIVFCHQDPDVAASIFDWLELKPELQVFTSPRTHRLLPYYGHSEYNWFNISALTNFTFDSGRALRFIEAPFLHSAGAFASYDEQSGFLFSGDVWAAIHLNWKLVIDNFADHVESLDHFHREYMSSNIACRGFVEKIQPLQIEAILPQHGSIIDAEDVPAALDYLENLRCGTDLVYPRLVDHD